MTALAEQVSRRRNFAIISHPDAGKTTLTEKLLLYGEAINLAGAVKARGDQRRATSDWMELEKQRGISITSTVLQFPYHDWYINLLDTPGHQDFSEDTYRTLAAADNAVMLIDAAKGIEPQTRKLFDVCRMRGLPIFTFVNKMDRPGREALELLDEIERTLGIGVYPANWPIGSGDTFRGVYDRLTHSVHLFERVSRGKKQAPVQVRDLYDGALKELIGADLYKQLLDDMEVLEGAGEEFDLERVHRGLLSPVFFGSAMTNFGVQLFFDTFIQYAAPPGPQLTREGVISPEEEAFSGFVFKIQANMDPKHRDRVAFIRVCSGRFEKDMTVQHMRSGKKIRLTRPQKLFAQDREIVEEAYAGDIVGLMNPGVFAIGDTVCAGTSLQFEGIPQFAPEYFALLRNPVPSKYKQFQKGLSELQEEGAVQVMYYQDDAKRDPILAAVGQLQFDVVRFRLESEYNVETILEPLPYRLARWIEGTPEDIANIDWYFDTVGVKDHHGRFIILFKNEWGCDNMIERNPNVKFLKVAPL